MGKADPTGPLSHGKEFGLYSKNNGKPLLELTLIVENICAS